MNITQKKRGKKIFNKLYDHCCLLISFILREYFRLGWIIQAVYGLRYIFLMFFMLMRLKLSTVPHQESVSLASSKNNLLEKNPWIAVKSAARNILLWVCITVQSSEKLINLLCFMVFLIYHQLGLRYSSLFQYKTTIQNLRILWLSHR